MSKELKYIIEGECHICISHAVNGDGYPYIYKNNKHWRLSRWVYTTEKGEIPEKLIIRHTCDNRKCINPEHLILGTKAENNRDRKERGRNSVQNGENSTNPKLSLEEVENIKNLYFEQKKYQKDIAKLYNISQTMVSKIVLNKSWKVGEQNKKLIKGKL